MKKVFCIAAVALAMGVQTFADPVSIFGKVQDTLTGLPLDSVIDSYLALAPETRYREITVDQHVLDESVLAILPGVEVPQYQRM